MLCSCQGRCVCVCVYVEGLRGSGDAEVGIRGKDAAFSVKEWKRGDLEDRSRA